jgi:hypothetical protein
MSSLWDHLYEVTRFRKHGGKIILTAIRGSHGGEFDDKNASTWISPYLDKFESEGN